MTFERGTSGRTLGRVAASGMVQSVAIPAASFISLPLVISDIGVEAYGWWSALAAFSALLVILDGGIRVFVLRLTATHVGQAATIPVEQIRRLLGMTVACSGVVLLAVVLARTWLAEVLIAGLSPGEVQHLSLLLVILVATTGVRLYNGVLFALVGGVQRGDVTAIALTTASVVTVVVNIVAAELGAGVDCFAYGTVAGTVILCAAALWGSRHACGTAEVWRPSRPRRDDLPAVRASAILLAAGLLRTVDVPLVRVTASHEAGADAVAVLTIATTLLVIGVSLACAPAGGLLTAVAERVDSHERAVRVSIDLASALAAGAALGILVLGPGVLSLWLGGQAHEGSAGLPAMAAALPLIVAFTLSWTVGVGLGDERMLAAYSLVGVVGVVVIGTAGAWLAGAAGAALALPVVYALLVVAEVVRGRPAARHAASRMVVHCVCVTPIVAIWLVLAPVTTGWTGFTGATVCVGVAWLLTAGLCCERSTRAVVMVVARRGLSFAR